MVKINPKDIEFVIMAHSKYPKKPSKAFRKWDGKTPYYMHPIWCAATLSTETTLNEKIREIGIQALLHHDILEDTTISISKGLEKEVTEVINHMTFPGGSKQEMEEIWAKPIEVKLYKLYDKVSNLLDGTWMDTEKKKDYIDYTRRLMEEVEQTYGELNITRIAKEITREEKD